MKKQTQAALNEIRDTSRKITASMRGISVENLVAFSGHRPARQDCAVDCNGTVYVYDSIANYLTTVHSISDADQYRIREAVAAGKTIL